MKKLIIVLAMCTAIACQTKPEVVVYNDKVFVFNKGVEKIILIEDDKERTISEDEE